ncbi:DUF2214 family protein [Pseudomonas asplenii]|uniref:Putative membrane protein n=1 Tax=Pseudomonas asplenii TaxID=53407 RepID=A0A0M9GH88_9PSED|nr:DUF2214 family protein [Pseudomonas fuscovaginae]KPA91191.1 putative membrane protein [Pseudomonas fuscovaginae]KPA99673.1 putative membrane protein [Pseudomonas fuscovaginae]
MLVHWFLAALHLLAYGIALAAVFGRGGALLRLGGSAATDLRPVFVWDNLWGISAAVLLITGGLRAFGGFEKGSDYYLHQPLFHLKLTLFVIVLLLELTPMISLIKWRIAQKKGASIDIRRARLFARLSHVEALLIMLIVIAASGMARGFLAG